MLTSRVRCTILVGARIRSVAWVCPKDSVSAFKNVVSRCVRVLVPNDMVFAVRSLVSKTELVSSWSRISFSWRSLLHFVVSHNMRTNSVYTDKNKNKIFLIYKEIQNEAVAKSNMRKGFLIYEEMGKYLTIYEKAVSHL